MVAPTESSNGGIAQLGERLLCKQEVVGSIPSASTITRIERGVANGDAALFFDIVYRKRSEKSKYSSLCRLGRVEGMGKQGRYGWGSSPARNEP